MVEKGGGVISFPGDWSKRPSMEAPVNVLGFSIKRMPPLHQASLRDNVELLARHAVPRT